MVYNDNLVWLNIRKVESVLGPGNCGVQLLPCARREHRISHVKQLLAPISPEACTPPTLNTLWEFSSRVQDGSVLTVYMVFYFRDEFIWDCSHFLS